MRFAEMAKRFGFDARIDGLTCELYANEKLKARVNWQTMEVCSDASLEAWFAINFPGVMP